MSLRRRLLSLLLNRFADDPPPLRLAFWDREVFEFSAAPRVTLILRTPRTAHDFLFGRFDRLGDAYVAGDILVDGDIGEVLRTGIELAQRVGKTRWLAPLLCGIGLLSFRHSRTGDAGAIAHHYDISDDFYRAVEDLRPHYARTLALWVERLEANRDAVIAAGGIERYRIWRVYLAGMAQAFDRGWLSVAQVVAYKRTAAGPAPCPWTRDHQYAADG
jgi:hypothetical protein